LASITAASAGSVWYVIRIAQHAISRTLEITIGRVRRTLHLALGTTPSPPRARGARRRNAFHTAAPLVVETLPSSDCRYSRGDGWESRLARVQIRACFDALGLREAQARELFHIRDRNRVRSKRPPALNLDLENLNEFVK
jgi:hypothetical protein